MSQSRSQWEDCPPQDYPFEKDNYSKLDLQSKEVLKEIRQLGKQQLRKKEYKDALWKYEHYVLYSKQHISATSKPKYADATVKCAMLFLRISYNNGITLSQKLRCYEKSKQYCEECFQLGIDKYKAKAYSFIAEAFELESELQEDGARTEYLIRAYESYKISFEMKNDISTLFKLILTCINSESDTQELIKYQEYLLSKAGMLQALLKEISESGQVKSCHMSFFFVREKFCIPLISDVVDLQNICGIIERCWQLGCPKAIHIIWEDLLNETKLKILSSLTNDLRAELLKQTYMTTEIRTRYLAVCLDDQDIVSSLVAIQSGIIHDQHIYIPKFKAKILAPKFDLSVLQTKLKTQHESEPLNYLIKELSHICANPGKRFIKKKAVQLLTMLIRAGGNVEGLTAYNSGINTSPLIVATHLAVDTDNEEIVAAVVKKKLATADVNVKKAFQIAQKSTCKCKDELVKLLMKLNPKVFEESCDTCSHLLDLPNGQIDCGKSKRKQKRKQKVKLSTETESSSVLAKEREIPDRESQEINLISDSQLHSMVEELLKIELPTTKDIQENVSQPDIRKQLDPVLIKETPEIRKSEYEHLKNSSTQTDSEEFKFESQLWEVEIHERVASFAKDKSQPYKIRDQLFKKLQKLSSGDWNVKLHKPLQHKNDIQIFEAKLTKAARILYQIAVRFSERQTEKIQQVLPKKQIRIYSQTIMVWDVVLDHDKIHHSVECMKQNIEMVNVPNSIFPFQSKGEMQSVIYPQMYSTPKLDETTQKKVIEILGKEPESLNNVQEYDTGVKMYSVTNDLILSFLDRESNRKDYPIKTTDEEHDIIMLSTREPVLVMGRSGTGKTTTCLNRLWLSFSNYWREPDRINNPLFPNPYKSKCSLVSKDDPLLESDMTSETILHSQISSSEGGCCLVDSKIGRESADEHLHQIFITKNHALCAKMKKRFYDFVAGHKALENHLVYENEPLPKTLTEIQHFPIFLTARQFFMILDRSIGIGKQYFDSSVDIVDVSANQADSHAISLLLDMPEDDESDSEDEPAPKRKIIEITANEFSYEIWPKISKYCTDSRVDPILIWTEFESFIEGSAQALKNPTGFLSENEYCSKIGVKQAPNFSLKREEVYKLFTEYKRLIKHKGEITKQRFDNGEFIWSLNERLEKKGLQNIPWSIHELYIDEAQDFTQAELLVILKCCRYPNRSFLAGDTAQTIIKGISFRFEDLKSLFRDLKIPGVKCEVPILRTLSINHRSHSSITKLATSLTDLLKEYFPHSFDIIADDRSNICGPKPLFICSKKLLENFLLPRESSGSSIEFGADQVVIARDSSEEGKPKLPQFLDEIVLNPQECKGLEFNDVLLYNFFTDTPEQNKELWKISAFYLENNAKKIVTEEPFHDYVHPVQFNSTYHKSLCSELKMLYTVVTRAKRHIWIYEDKQPNDLPMLEYWYRRDLVEVMTEPSDSKDFPLQNSSLQDWKQQGDIYMEKKLWRFARKCYKKAQEGNLERYAYAHTLQERAINTKAAAAIFLEHSQLFPKKEHVQKAAVCLYKAEMYLKSVQLFEKIKQFGIAIQICKRFLKNKVDTLVRLTEKSVGYKAAIRVYLRRQKHESALRLAHSYMSKNYLSQDECYTLLKDVTHQCIRRAIQNKSCTLSEDIAKFVQIIPDTREQAHFLKEANMYNAACDSLCQQGQYTSAYRICRAQHLYGKGIEIAHFAGPDHSQNRHLFILLQAEQQLINLQEPLHLLEGQAQLEQLLKVDDLRTEYRARAYLLLSIMALGSEKMANSEVQRLCLKAYRLYSKNKSGEIEAFCILNEIRGRMNENTVEHGKMLIDMIASVDQLCTLLKKNAAVFTLEINQIERFYGLERYGSNSYCVPQHHSYFLRLVMKKQVVDSDGMLELDRNNVIEQLICHYNTLINYWKTCVKNVEVAWLTRIEQFFSFHFELMDKPYYLQREHRKFSPEQVNEYLQMCEIALQMKQLNSSIFENNDITVALRRILSPFSQLRLPFQKENYLVMVSSDSVTGWTILKDKISKECKKIAANNNYKTPS